MFHSVPLISLRRLVAILLMLPGLFAPATLATAQSSDGVLTTKYFKIYYPAGEAKTATWYAGFADDVDVSVSELLSARPVEGLTLRIYATEAEYSSANPMAEVHPGILAHVILERKEIGVAVERLRQAPPELARESFRHEMTHVVAGELSNQNLPIGFQEGFAQYNELSSSRGHEVAQTLQAAQAAGQPLLSLLDLNDDVIFRSNLDIAYPQSYAVMAFLADRFGMAPFSRFLEVLRLRIPYDNALSIAYSMPVEELDKQWQQYLPQFLKDGWQVNILQADDLGVGTALYDAGRFAEAREQFARSERLFTDLHRNGKAREAADYRARAEQAEKASETAVRARQSLEKYDYDSAKQDAVAAEHAFSVLTLEDYRQRAQATAQLAAQGSEAVTLLQAAQRHKESFNLSQTQDEARQAGATFAQLGDAPRVAQVNAILAELGFWQWSAGLSALAGGVLCLLLGALAARRSQRKASILPMAVQQLREENRSWL